VTVGSAHPLHAQSRRANLALALLLGVTQTIGYGTLYYAFGVVAPLMQADTGLSLTAIYGVFSLSMLASGLAAPAIGRLFDRHNPAVVMAAGSLAAGAALAAWSMVPGTVAFVVLLLAVQTASILVLYEAAFVVAAHYAAAGTARRTITGITFIAGFASTIFWPLTQWLTTAADWRGIYLAYAGMQVFICFPLHLLIWFRLQPVIIAVDDAEGSRTELGSVEDPDLRRRIMPLLLAGFAANAFVISAVHMHLIGLLAAIGLGTSSALVGALIGPAQVAARVVEFATARKVSIHLASLAAVLALPIALAILMAGAPMLVAAVAFAIIFGAGQGLSYIVRGVLPLELFGRKGYGAVTGRINSARLFVSAAAPFLTAFLFENAGFQAATGTILAAALLSAVCIVLVSRLARLP
jgi:MFS family permease